MKYKACLKCFDVRHEIYKCPEEARLCSKCLVTHGPGLLCRPEDKEVENRSTPDEAARENKMPVVHVNTRPALTGPQPKGAAKTEKRPEQPVPNAQAMEEKKFESLRSQVIVDEKIPTIEPNIDKTLMFAPS